MSFSIPTLRAFCNKITGTLNAPVISMVGDCGSCGYNVSGTITADVGNRVAFKVTTFSDSSSMVSCSDYTYITTGNIAYLDNTVGTDHFSCVSRMPSGARILAVACNGSAFSNTANEYLTAIACPTSIPAPTINIVSNTGGVVTYNVTTQYCSTTYVNDSSRSAPQCQPPSPDANNIISDPRFTVVGSGVTSSNYTVTNCTQGANVSIVAVTVWDTNPLCTNLQSSVSSTGVTVN